MEIKRVGTQASAKGPSDWFTGSVRIDPLFQAPDPAFVQGASVTFEPGARTAWHTHPLGQTLIVTTGCGWAQRDGAIGYQGVAAISISIGFIITLSRLALFSGRPVLNDEVRMVQGTHSQSLLGRGRGIRRDLWRHPCRLGSQGVARSTC